MSVQNKQSAVLANVASSAASVTLFAANGRASGRFVFNDSTAILYIKFGSAAASTTSHTIAVAAGAYFTFPSPVYGGPVTAIWAAANGFARTTEW